MTQMYASLRYIQMHHAYADIPGQPPVPDPRPVNAQTNGTSNAEAKDNEKSVGQRQDQQPETPLPDAPDVFQNAMRELAQDLVLKEQQIEVIVNSLPGIGNSEAGQEARLRELEAEMRVVEEERRRAQAQKEAMVDQLGEVIGKIKRVR